MYAFDPAERAVVGIRKREWTAVARTEESVVREMARCLAEISAERQLRERNRTGYVAQIADCNDRIARANAELAGIPAMLTEAFKSPSVVQGGVRFDDSKEVAARLRQRAEDLEGAIRTATFERKQAELSLKAMGR